jgi:hypothetical protein
MKNNNLKTGQENENLGFLGQNVEEAYTSVPPFDLAMNMTGNQFIACNVSSCQYFKNSHCELSSIEVGACNNSSSGLPEDETLCSSYVKRN